jgi:hypothetical protein
LDRAGPRNLPPFTGDPDLHLLVDGRRIDAMEHYEETYAFRLPASPRTVRIRSRAAVPQELGTARDARLLGVALRRIVLAERRRHRIIDANFVGLVEGFHALEPEDGIRWTDGDATLPTELFAETDGPCMLMVHLGGATQYLELGKSARAA